jgi:hypothetical protein
MPDQKNTNEATEHADLYQRHEQTPDGWEKADAVTGRPNDTPIREDAWAVPNSTLASRAKAAKRGPKPEDDAETKQVQAAENKRVGRASTKKG